MIKSSLFGIKKSNRDFSLKDAWGKNQFNSSFPAALCCYLAAKNLSAICLGITEQQFAISTIEIEKVFGLAPSDPDIYFAFESQYMPYQKFVIGPLPRIDLVIQRESNGQCLSGLEVKLTALPDNATCHLDEAHYGSEIVVRPDTIVYLACSIADSLGNNLLTAVPQIDIIDWSNPKLVLAKIDSIMEVINKLAFILESQQQAFLIQPIWKTLGKSPKLANNCLDVFVWTNAGFVYFISKVARQKKNNDEINRQTRTVIWLYKMLLDISLNQRFNYQRIIDELSYNTKNDKAFASSGNVTNKVMKCERLQKPLIAKHEIKNIILGEGQNLLSPERRFDAILFNSPELFN